MDTDTSTRAVEERANPELSVTASEVCCESEECKLEVDVILCSSDGVLLGAHSKNLELYSEGFPPASFAAAGNNSGPGREIVQLTESSSVLKLLLRYLHNQRQPDSSQWEFQTLADLAEAAEKYMVYSAMEVCKIRMELSISEHPLPVLLYAVKHNHPKLRDTAAPLTISEPLSKIAMVLQDVPHAFAAWVQYREGFMQVVLSLFKRPAVPGLHRGGAESCDAWGTFYSKVLEEFERGPNAVRNISHFPQIIEERAHYINDCQHCKSRAYNWKNSVLGRVSLLPSFSSFL